MDETKIQAKLEAIKTNARARWALHVGTHVVSDWGSHGVVIDTRHGVQVGWNGTAIISTYTYAAALRQLTPVG